MKALRGKLVDRGIARMIAIKRCVSGGLSLVAGVGVSYFAVTHGGRPFGLTVLALVLLFGGGAWALRDGVRLLRVLKRP